MKNNNNNNNNNCKIKAKLLNNRPPPSEFKYYLAALHSPDSRNSTLNFTSILHQKCSYHHVIIGVAKKSYDPPSDHYQVLALNTLSLDEAVVVELSVRLCGRKVRQGKGLYHCHVSVSMRDLKYFPY